MYPCIQMGLFGVRHDEVAVTSLLAYVYLSSTVLSRFACVSALTNATSCIYSTIHAVFRRVNEHFCSPSLMELEMSSPV